MLEYETRSNHNEMMGKKNKTKKRTNNDMMEERKMRRVMKRKRRIPRKDNKIKRRKKDDQKKSRNNMRRKIKERTIVEAPAAEKEISMAPLVVAKHLPRNLENKGAGKSAPRGRSWGVRR